MLRRPIPYANSNRNAFMSFTSQLTALASNFAYIGVQQLEELFHALQSARSIWYST